MIISQLNDSLCFKEVIMGNLCGKISTFDCKVLYIFLKKVHFTDSQTSLTAPVIWNIAESMFDFHHTGQFGEHHVAGLAKLCPCAPITPPPQRTTVPSGGMLNQHVDFCLTCVWTHGLYWEYCLTSPFFPESVPAVQDLLHSVTFWPRCRALQLTDSWSWWELQIRLWWPVKYHLRLKSKQCTGVVFYMSVVILLGDMESVLDPPTEQLKLRGAKISHESGCILKIRENIGNYFCFLLLFLFFFLAWNKRDSFLRCSKMMSRNSIRLIKGQNQIELIYRVNSESLKMKKKKYELDFFWNTNCVWTEEEPYSLPSGNLLPRWLGEEVPTVPLLLFQW